MVGVLILSHGDLAQEFLAAARIIAADPLPGFEALSLSWDGDLNEARSTIKNALPRLDCGDGVLILTDIFGATPSNVALGFRDAGNVEVVAGINLAMVVRLGCLTRENMPLAKLALWIRDKGRSAICTGAQSAPQCEDSDGRNQGRDC